MHIAKEIAFGGFRLDFTNECLWQDRRAISLRPKAFAVLRLLIERPGLLVTKQQVLDTVWPGTFVGDGVLKDNIRQLREALHDDAASPAFIETAHRRGYRFIGKFTEAESIENAASPRLSPESHHDAALTSSITSTGVLGRDAELLKMRGWLERALAGERQTIFITGEPGIGKTTVVQAFLEQIAEVPGLRVSHGQCLEHYGAGEAYLPMLDGFSRLCRSPQGAQVLDVLRQQAPAWLAEMPSLLPQSERKDLQTHVVAATRERMLREMADAIETLASEAPLLLVLEDLHWSDYSTLDLVAYLSRRKHPARLMIIGTYRPVDVIVDDHPLKGVKRELQAHGLCRELPLEYLSKHAVKEYLDARFPGHEFPLGLRRTISQRSEGNPLFMVSLVDYLVDEAVIIKDHGIWKMQTGCSEIEEGIPTNIRQLIERQIERLSADERTVLEAASVAGMESSSVAIAAGLAMPIEWVEKQCEELARRHQFLSPAWLVELPDGTVTPRHRFIHILYRDVPYRLMSPMRRSQIHQRIADRGVAIYGERRREIAAELAMHFEQSRDWQRALQYLVQAAENATHKSAHHEAASLARRGLEALKALPKSAEGVQQEINLRMILSVSLMATKGFASSELAEVYSDGKDLFGVSEQSTQLFNMLYLLGFSYIMGGKLEAALGIAKRLVALAAQLEDPTLVMEAHRAMGASLIELGRCTEALEHLDQASHLYSANRQHPYTLNIGHDCKVLSESLAARALWTLGLPDAALRRMQGALAFARELSHPQSSVGAAHFAAQLHLLRGEPLLAQQHAKEVAKLADEYGLEYWVALGKIDLGWAEVELGNLEVGIEQMQQGLAAYEATGGKLWSSHYLSVLAEALCKACRTEEGLAVISKALMLIEVNGEAYATAELQRIKGELIIKHADQAPQKKRGRVTAAGLVGPTATLVQAQDCFEKAIVIAKQQQTKSWELRAELSLARFVPQMKAPRVQLAETYSWFTEGHDTADLRHAQAELSAPR